MTTTGYVIGSCIALAFGAALRIGHAAGLRAMYRDRIRIEVESDVTAVWLGDNEVMIVNHDRAASGNPSRTIDEQVLIGIERAERLRDG